MKLLSFLKLFSEKHLFSVLILRGFDKDLIQNSVQEDLCLRKMKDMEIKALTLFMLTLLVEVAETLRTLKDRKLDSCLWAMMRSSAPS